MSRHVIALMLFLFPLYAHANVTGKPRIVDGNTLEIAGQHVLLYGIDAPDNGQTCIKNGERWPCGTNSAFALAQFIGGNWVNCQQRGRDRANRLIAVCRLAGPQGPNVNRWMVSNGWALADRGVSQNYVVYELDARKARKGLWRGRFATPSEWRRGVRLITNPKSKGSCKIKGGVGRRGERIYYLPGSRSYTRIRIVPGRGGRWFCSEREARRAGWRKSKR